jgi:hypothetical protein
MAKSTEHALRLRLHSINMKATGFTVKSPNQGNMNLGNMLADQGSDFFNGAMGLRQGHGGHHGKIKRGSSGLGQGGGGGANMV